MRALFFLFGIILLGACTGGFGRGGAETRPDDFQALYEWSEGSLPPPYYYEYSIRIDPQGQGEVSMTPDYPNPGVPVWTETFSLSAEELDDLYGQMLSHGLLRTRWTREDDPPVGGSSEWLTVTAGGEEIRVPTFVPPRQQEQAEAMFEAVKAVVPQAIWDDLNALREAYVEEHSER